MEGIKKFKIRFFTLQSNDPSLWLVKDYCFGFLLNILVDELGIPLKNINVEVIFPFKKYIRKLFREKLIYFSEDYFVFYLENCYHSNNYAYYFLLLILDFIKKNFKRQPIVYIYSPRISKEHIDYLLDNYSFVEAIIKKDIELFFLEDFGKRRSEKQSGGVIYSGKKGNYLDRPYTYKGLELNYLLGSHYSGYLNNYYLSKDYIMSIIDEEDSNEIIPYLWSKEKKVSLLRNNLEDLAMIYTGRGCKYNCPYCYRGSKYINVRQLPLEIIKKDLDYLHSKFYRGIYVYDDCFVTTNLNRLDKIISLFNSYKRFYYGVSVRPEVLTKNSLKYSLKYILKLNIYRIQIGLQSVKKYTNSLIYRNFSFDKFTKIIKLLKLNNIPISIDIILGLPGDTYKDFIETLSYAISLEPKFIHINQLFLSPGTEFYNRKKEYGIIEDDPEKYLFSVPTVLYTNTFSLDQIKKAKEYIKRVSKNNPNINIILR